MYQDDEVIYFDGSETVIGEHVYHSERAGVDILQQKLLDDPKTGMVIKLNRYEAGQPCDVHWHECGKGMYVLAGRLHTDQGDFGPGSFVWWDAGTSMFHGATATDDADVFFVTTGAFAVHTLVAPFAPDQPAPSIEVGGHHGDPGTFTKDASLTNLGDHALVSKRTGLTRYECHLADDPRTGVSVKLVRYVAGDPTPVHTHSVGKGMYVLRGTLHTERGQFGPGSFIWWKPGTKMWHCAGPDEDVDVLFVTNGPLDIQYTGEEVTPE